MDPEKKRNFFLARVKLHLISKHLLTFSLEKKARRKRYTLFFKEDNSVDMVFYIEIDFPNYYPEEKEFKKMMVKAALKKLKDDKLDTIAIYALEKSFAFQPKKAFLISADNLRTSLVRIAYSEKEALAQASKYELVNPTITDSHIVRTNNFYHWLKEAEKNPAKKKMSAQKEVIKENKNQEEFNF